MPEFITRFEQEAQRFLEHETAIKCFLHADPKFIALCHWNAHIDNAWFWRDAAEARSEEHTSELQSLMRISYAVFCLKKQQQITDMTVQSEENKTEKHVTEKDQKKNRTKYTIHYNQQ